MTSNSLKAPPENAQTAPISWLSIFVFSLFHVGALFAPWCFSWSALGVAVFLNWLCGGVGICLGYHRLLTHRSLAVPKPLERLIAFCGSLAVQGGPIFWVAAHRRHHLHTEDYDKDPYSASRGFWWSHMVWLFYPQAEFWVYDTYKKFAPDLDKDPFYRWLDKYYIWLQLPLAIALYLCGGWSFVVYGIFVRNVFERHTTFLVNSACHMVGYRTYEDCKDNSRNLWWAALLTYGEGWHNNHHAFPNSAQTGIKWWEFDPTWWLVLLLQRLGLATRVQTPTTKGG
jgi:sn-2 palmitoyl-lipid 9-desaturase